MVMKKPNKKYQTLLWLSLGGFLVFYLQFAQAKNLHGKSSSLLQDGQLFFEMDKGATGPSLCVRYNPKFLPKKNIDRVVGAYSKVAPFEILFISIDKRPNKERCITVTTVGWGADQPAEIIPDGLWTPLPKMETHFGPEITYPIIVSRFVYGRTFDERIWPNRFQPYNASYDFSKYVRARILDPSKIHYFRNDGSFTNESEAQVDGVIEINQNKIIASHCFVQNNKSSDETTEFLGQCLALSMGMRGRHVSLSYAAGACNRKPYDCGELRISSALKSRLKIYRILKKRN
jgi:hypothetical protein